MKGTPMNATLTRTEELLAWTDGRVVLLVEREDDAWVIARSWKQADRLTDVRRWRFACERCLIGQMRRLVRERIAGDEACNHAALSLAVWLEAPVHAL
jgi:hypothetical protein